MFRAPVGGGGASERLLAAVVIASFVLTAAPTLGLDRDTAVAGLKEALSVGAGRAVDLLGQPDGYLGNVDVRIPMPERLAFVEKTLRTFGRDELVDEFVVAMNRAAEAAAPVAQEIFVDSIKEMSIEDAVRIARGEQHEATDYLEEHSRSRLAAAFEPVVADKLQAVGATRAFEDLMERAARNPLLGSVTFDLNAYVTGEALDGLFLMLAREEERIRADPAARTTELLKTVFGEGASDEKVPWWRRLFRRGDG